MGNHLLDDIWNLRLSIFSTNERNLLKWTEITEKEEENRQYQKDMQKVWDENYLILLEHRNEQLEQKRQWSALNEAYAKAIRLLDPTTYNILKAFSKLFGVKQTNIIQDTLFLVGDMTKYWSGELDGHHIADQSARKYVAGLATKTGAAGGAGVGSAMGALYGGSIGSVIGAGVGALAGSYTLQYLADVLYFNLLDYFRPLSEREKTLSMAYRFMELHHDASKQEVEHNYRMLAKKYHPDQGGKHEDFLALQASRAIITQSRQHL